MQEDKSILNQKCKCGEPIDYFELRGHIIRETIWKSKLGFKFSSLIAIIGSIILICVNANVILTSFGIGTFFGMMIMFYSEVKFEKNYKPNKIKKKFYHSKVRWSYYKSLSKKKQNAIIKGLSIVILGSVAPFFLIMMIMFSLLANQPNESSFLVIISGFLIYFALWKINPFTPFLRKRMISKLKEQGIDYQRFNRGVKSK